MRATGIGKTYGMDEHLARESVDLIVLDVMMPGEDGLAVCALAPRVCLPLGDRRYSFRRQSFFRRLGRLAVE